MKRIYGTVNLTSLQHNLSIVRQHAPLTRVMAVVKKDAYGHGLARVAQALDPHVEGFAVASVEEGIALREVPTSKPICVLSGVFSPDHLKPVLAYSLEPVIYCREQLQILNSRPHSPIKVWIKFDTGMNRLGFPIQHCQETIALIEHTSSLQIAGLMTHFACADQLDSEFTNAQIDRFQQRTSNWRGDVSLANSAGLLRWPRSRVGWVRPGVMLYGASPFADTSAEELGLQPVMNLYSIVLAMKTLKPGEGVGYGLKWKSSQTTKIGIVATGYGDGYHRKASGNSRVLVNNRPAKLIGRISMDSFAIDLSTVPDAKVGSPVKLFGDGLPVEEVASAASTLPYEIFTSLNPQTVCLVETESV